MTAVEWLVNEILVEVDRYDDEGNRIGIDYWNAYNSCTSLLEYVNKAKEMEKQQIIEAYIECKRQYVLQENCYPPQFVVKEAKKYYNEKFKKEK